MKITSVNIHRIDKENNRMKAIVSIVLDDCFVIHDIRIIQGDKNLFVAMPSRKTATGEYKDVAHPINPETRTLFEKTIIDEYNKN